MYAFCFTGCSEGLTSQTYETNPKLVNKTRAFYVNVRERERERERGRERVCVCALESVCVCVRKKWRDGDLINKRICICVFLLSEGE